MEIRNVLVERISKIDAKYEIAGIASGVKESIKWLRSFGAPDLIVSDVQFADGSCYDVLRQCNLFCPVIFIPSGDSLLGEDTIHPGTMMQLNRSARISRLVMALEKFQLDRQQLMSDNDEPSSFPNVPKWRKRIIIKKGKEYYPMQLKEVVLIYFENGIVFLINSDTKKCMVDADGLNLVYNNMDRSVFYRANRKHIFNVNYLSSYRSIGNNRILVELIVNIPETIIISQYRSNEFRAWIERLSINAAVTSSR